MNTRRAEQVKKILETLDDRRATRALKSLKKPIETLNDSGVVIRDVELCGALKRLDIRTPKQTLKQLRSFGADFRKGLRNLEKLEVQVPKARNALEAMLGQVQEAQKALDELSKT